MASPEETANKALQPQRDSTDQSLRIEREKADAAILEQREDVETQADAVVHQARERADKLLETARADADRELEELKARTLVQRDRQDGAVGLERATADALLRDEREARRRYLTDYFEDEREATDRDLSGERFGADQLIAARDEFLGRAGHDLRSLLGGLALNADVILRSAPEGAGGEDLRKHASANRRLVARMNRLVNDLLDVVSMQAGTLAVVPEPVEVARLLQETVEALGPLAAAKDVTLAVVFPHTPVHADLDEGRILQVLANLVNNAIKFTPAKGQVSIRVYSSTGVVRFSISDTGVGISPEELPTIFERFHQVRRDRRGLGLGLHIAKGIVEAHRGRIWAESELGVGSTFHFSLPLKSPDGHRDQGG